MSEELFRERILDAWKEHAGAVRSASGEDGPFLNTIDMGRQNAIEVVKIIIHNFIKGDFDINDFKLALDSYNRHNNLWGFTAKLGQMYFNQLIMANEGHLQKLSNMLKELITEPKNLKDALGRIDTLETYTNSIYSKAKDKHSAPYPGAAGYFLSYFWQIANYQKWPILYNTLVNAFRELGVWEEQKTQKETYNLYYTIYNNIRRIIDESENRKVSYWEIEHAFWNYKPKVVLPVYQTAAQPVPAAETVSPATETAEAPSPVITEQETPVAPAEQNKAAEPPKETLSGEAVNIREYLIPRLHSLLDASSDSEEKSGDRYRRMVAEVFAQMGFEIEECDTSEGKNAFAVLRFREENIAYILDAEADSKRYFEENDRRLVKEYVNEICSRLRREGYKRTAYVLVSDAFEDSQKTFASFMDWNTEVRKTYMVSTAAALYLLAYKLQNRLGLYRLLERMAELPACLDADNIAAELNR